jgi:hypothetical protein
MRGLRTILAVLLVLSVAMLPGAGFVPGSADAAMATMHADCCPDSQPCPDDGNKANHDCGSAVACALKCFKYCGGAGPVAKADPVVIAQLSPVLAADSHSSKSSTPPLPPPRL